jgi:hypothetical protein
MPLWKIGLIVFIAAGVVNAVLINLDIGGLIRELARLSILTGLVLLVVGIFKRKR